MEHRDEINDPDDNNEDEDEQEIDDLDDRFPKTEEEILRLARQISAGLRAHPDLFPNPPFSADQIDASINSYLNAREAEILSRVALERANAERDRAFEDFLRTARRLSGRPEDEAGETPTPAEEPGPAGFLEILRKGDTKVSIGWTEPRDGGEAEIYMLYRREDEKSGWKFAGATFDTAATMEQQPGAQVEYCVRAMNRHGQGPDSNVARVVL
jgi:hypothetical protein